MAEQVAARIVAQTAANGCTFWRPRNKGMIPGAFNPANLAAAIDRGPAAPSATAVFPPPSS